MKAYASFRRGLNELVQSFLRELVAEVVAAHSPAPLPLPPPPKKARPRRRKAKPLSGRVSKAVFEKLAAAVEPSLHLSAPRAAVEKGEVVTAAPAPTLPEVIVTSPAKRWGLERKPAPAQPKPAGAPALMGAPRQPEGSMRRWKTHEELVERGHRGAEAAKASRATERALGPTAKTSMSDDELEAWATERLAAGDLPAVMTFSEEDEA